MEFIINLFPFFIFFLFLSIMYFAVGWPRVFNSSFDNDESICAFHSHPTKDLLLIVTNKKIYIWWQGQSSVLLGLKHGKEGNIFVSGVWCCIDDNDCICILDHNGCLLFFNVLFSKKQLEYKFNKKLDSNNYLPLQSIRSIIINEYYSINELNIECICFIDSFIVGGTKNGKLILYNMNTKKHTEYNLENNILSPVPEYLPTKSIDNCNSFHIIDISYTDGLLGFVFKNGRAAIVSLSLNPSIHSSNYEFNEELFHEISLLSEDHPRKGKWLIQSGATKMVFSKRHHLLAVGHESGEVSLFESVHVDNDEYKSDDKDKKHQEYDSFDILRIFSLSQWGISPLDTGKVIQLEWSPDGNTIAVGWEERGMCVWSIYGCKLMCTIPYQIGGKSNQDISIDKPKNIKEPFKNGINALTWGTEGYSIWGFSKDYYNELIQINFIRTSLVQNPSLHYAKSFILQGAEKIYQIDKCSSSSFSSTKILTQLQVPQTYLNDNWPIRYISVNRNGTDIAAAGKKGIITYNSIKKRWRLFGDQKQEQKIQCISLTWFKRCVIILNQIKEKGKIGYELLSFPHSHLSYSSLLLQETLSSDSIPISMDCNDSRLVIFMKNGFYIEYTLKPIFSKNDKDEIQFITLEKLHQMSSTGVHSLLSSLILPPLEKDNEHIHSPEKIDKHSHSSNSIESECFMLDSTGRLSITNLTHAEDIELATSIEQFWYCGIQRKNSDNLLKSSLKSISLKNTLWAYGEGGMRLWFPFINSTSVGGSHCNSNEKKLQSLFIQPENSLKFDNEVYPLSFSSSQGVIVGVSQITSYSNASEYPRYDVMVRPQPFIHILLSKLLSTNENNFKNALSFAKSASMLSHFEHSLELLLHETLENNEKLLSIVCKFLSNFRTYPEIIVRCARKTDVSHWDKLFTHAGVPMNLFTMCLQRNFISSAGSYLRIIQIIHSMKQAKKAGHLLLEAVIENEKISMLPDLLLFLEPDRYNESQSDETFLTSTGISISRGDDEEEEEYFKELILSRYARKLLARFSLRKFCSFVSKTQYSMRHWFIKERERATKVDQFRIAIDTIHKDYNLPYPISFDEDNIDDIESGVVLTPRKEKKLIEPLSPVREYYPQTGEQSDILYSEMTLERTNSPRRESSKKTLKNSNGITFILRSNRDSLSSLPHELWNQLEDLLIESFNAHCYDFCIVLAFVTMNVKILLNLFEGNSSTWIKFQSQLISHPS